MKQETKQRGRSGRPIKLTPELHERLVSRIAAGAYKQHAALECGIADKTIHNWIHRGEQGEEPFATFLRDIRKAEGQAIYDALSIINACARAGNWKAAAWKLERKYPDQFGQSRFDSKVQRGVEQVLEAAREYMSEAAYDELITAIVRVQGIDTTEVTNDVAAE